MSNLRKLYLERNFISRLEGLHKCTQLEELYLSKQTIPDFVEFTFDETLTLPSLGVRNVSKFAFIVGFSKDIVPGALPCCKPLSLTLVEAHDSLKPEG